MKSKIKILSMAMAKDIVADCAFLALAGGAILLIVAAPWLGPILIGSPSPMTSEIRISVVSLFWLAVVLGWGIAPIARSRDPGLRDTILSKPVARSSFFLASRAAVWIAAAVGVVAAIALIALLGQLQGVASVAVTLTAGYFLLLETALLLAFASLFAALLPARAAGVLTILVYGGGRLFAHWMHAYPDIYPPWVAYLLVGLYPLPPEAGGSAVHLLVALACTVTEVALLLALGRLIFKRRP